MLVVEDWKVSYVFVAIEVPDELELNFVAECDGVSLGYPLVAAIFFKILTKEVGETLSFIKSNSILKTSASNVTPLKLQSSRSSSSKLLEFVRVTVTLYISEEDFDLDMFKEDRWTDLCKAISFLPYPCAILAWINNDW